MGERKEGTKERKERREVGGEGRKEEFIEKKGI